MAPVVWPPVVARLTGPLKIILNWVLKKFSQGYLVAVRPPILTKSGRKGAGKYFLTILGFSGEVWTKNNFFVLFFIWSDYKLFPFQPLKNTIMTMQNFFLYFAEFFSVFCKIYFSNWPRNLGQTWQHRWALLLRSMPTVHTERRSDTN